MSEHVIEVASLRKEFGSFVAVRDVSFHVERGEIFGYLGANGAGKSTTIRMLCGLLPPTSGKAIVAGHDALRHPQRVKASIGYMSQRFSLYLDLSAEHNLEFFGGIYGLAPRELDRAIDRACERTALSEYRRTTTGELPGGIRQRLALACSLLHQPRIVFLDEPTAGVDPSSRRAFWRLIRELAHEGTTVFVTTHYMDEAEYCARIGLMVDGSLVALDTPSELKKRFVPGEVIAIEGKDLHRALEAIRGAPGVLAAEPFGARLHVRFETGWVDRPLLEELLRTSGASASHIEAIEASLEDVFLAAVGKNGGKAAAA
jgi:ABC-2 type transport system ATP-binding protein